MDIVRIIAVAHQAVVVGGADEGFVGAGGGDVDADRVAIAADDLIDVAWHMDEMGGAGHAIGGEAIGGGFGAFCIAGFEQMDHQMRRLDMGGIARLHRFDQADGGAGAPDRGLAVGLPIIPRAGVHRRFGGQQGDIVIGWEARRERQHRIGIGAVERGAVGIGITGIA